jgi:uncharacterized RDD family membrane protein YckC
VNDAGAARVSSNELRIESATGVDIVMRIAGPGGRAYAFIIDWHIRLVLALAWYVGATLAYNQRLSLAVPVEMNSAWYIAVLLPTFALYFLYHPVLEIAMGGRTPGKRIAQIRIVATDGGAPSPGALLMRNVFRLIDCLPLVYCVGLVATLVTRRHVRIGDLAAGTLLVYEQNAPQGFAHIAAQAGRAAPATGPMALAPDALEIAVELLARWHELDADARRGLARDLLARAAPQHTGAVLTDAELHERVAALAGLATGPA